VIPRARCEAATYVLGDRGTAPALREIARVLLRIERRSVVDDVTGRGGIRPRPFNQTAPAEAASEAIRGVRLANPRRVCSLGRTQRCDPPAGSAVLNGVVAVRVMVTMMLLTMRRSIMAGFTLPPLLLVMGWLATATMAVTTVAMVASWFD
jgi:hypothetical protein